MITNSIKLAIIIVLTFLAGMGHQFKVDESKVNQTLELSMDCDYIIPSDLDYSGELAAGVCLTPEADTILIDHFFSQLISDSNLVKIRANNLW